MKNNVALVTLTEYGGEETVFVVPQMVVQWINSNLPEFGAESQVKDKLPTEIYDFFVKSAENNEFADPEDVCSYVWVSTGSPYNDRALQMIVADDHTFYDKVDAIDFCKKNKLDIVDTYDGLCY